MPLLTSRAKRFQAKTYYAPKQSLVTTSPLTVGLLAWWRVVPRLSRGFTWYDLVSGRTATLTNTAERSATSGWGSTSRNGGAGEVRLNGVDNYVDMGTFPAFSTAALFVKPGTRSGFDFYVGQNNFRLYVDQTTGNLFFGDSLVGGVDTGISMDTFTDQWVHIIAINDGANSRVYINGIQQGTSVALEPVVANTLNIGRFVSGVHYTNGAFDDIRFFTITPSVSIAQELYHDALLGATHTLARFPLRTRFFAFSSPAASYLFTAIFAQTKVQALTPRTQTALDAVKLQTTMNGLRLRSSITAQPAVLQTRLPGLTIQSRVTAPAARLQTMLGAASIRSVRSLGAVVLQTTLSPLMLRNLMRGQPALLQTVGGSLAIRSALALTPAVLQTQLGTLRFHTVLVAAPSLLQTTVGRIVIVGQALTLRLGAVVLQTQLGAVALRNPVSLPPVLLQTQGEPLVMHSPILASPVLLETQLGPLMLPSQALTLLMSPVLLETLLGTQTPTSRLTGMPALLETMLGELVIPRTLILTPSLLETQMFGFAATIGTESVRVLPVRAVNLTLLRACAILLLEEGR